MTSNSSYVLSSMHRWRAPLDRAVETQQFRSHRRRVLLSRSMVTLRTYHKEREGRIVESAPGTEPASAARRCHRGTADRALATCPEEPIPTAGNVARRD